MLQRVLSIAMVLAALGGLVSCNRHDKGRRNEPAARQIGREAYGATQEIKRGAKEAAQELREAGKELRQGWKEAKREDPPKRKK